MGSFKLEKGGTHKQQALSAGALLLILGILTYIFFVGQFEYVAYILMGLGLAFVIGSFVAKE